MAEFEHLNVDVGGLTMHAAASGPADGRTVLLCHGFPESWYSWRYQLRALGEAGYRVIAPDQRGYGRTDAPEDVADYSQLNLVGDLVGLLDALGIGSATVVGHDWGAPVAWNAAMLRPDLFPAVVGISVPFGPRFFDPRATCLNDLLREPDQLPDWLAEEDLDVFTAEFERKGTFRYALNWYRNIDRSWAQMAPFRNRGIDQPALFIGAERDAIFGLTPEHVLATRQWIPRLAEPIWVPDCGHWVQQEEPEVVNAALLDFLDSTA